MSDQERLRALLLGEEQRRIEALEEQLRDRRQRMEEMADLLPQAIQVSKSDSLTKSLAGPVSDSLKTAIQRDPQPIADALFPVIGPAIRKSIAEAIKEFANSINHMIEMSVSPKSFRWRIQAMRTGTAFSEIVLKNTLSFRISRALLIDRDSGLLIAQADDGNDNTGNDSDAVSGMLTAVQDFVRDAFSGGNDDELATIDMGGYALWVLRGPTAMLAVVVHGVAPTTLRSQLLEILEDIHLKYGTQLTEFTGDRDAFTDISLLLSDCLQSERRERKSDTKSKKTEKKKKSWLPALFILLTATLTAAIWWHKQSSPSKDSPERGHWVDSIRAEPGIVIVSDDGHNIQLLVDPAAANPMVGKPEYVSLTIIPFYSLEPSLILRRTRAQLQTPDTVQLTLKNGVLSLTGTAQEPWLDRIADLRFLPPGIESINLDQLSLERISPLAQVKRGLSPPEGVGLHLEDGVLYLAGDAPWQWIAETRKQIDSINVVERLNSDNLNVTEWIDAQLLKARVERARFSTTISDYAVAAKQFAALVPSIKQLASLNNQAPLDLNIVLLLPLEADNSDDGDPGFANQIRKQLIDEGIPAELINTAVDSDNEDIQIHINIHKPDA